MKKLLIAILFLTAAVFSFPVDSHVMIVMSNGVALRATSNGVLAVSNSSYKTTADGILIVSNDGADDIINIYTTNLYVTSSITNSIPIAVSNAGSPFYVIVSNGLIVGVSNAGNIYVIVTNNHAVGVTNIVPVGVSNTTPFNVIVTNNFSVGITNIVTTGISNTTPFYVISSNLSINADGFLETINEEHEKVHDGKMFQIYQQWLDLGNGVNADLVFKNTNSSGEMHVYFELSCWGKGTWALRTNILFNSASGTLLSQRQMNDYSNSVLSPVIAYCTPGITNAPGFITNVGQTLNAGILGGGQGAGATGDRYRSWVECVLKTNVNFNLNLSNASAAAQSANIKLWYYIR